MSIDLDNPTPETAQHVRLIESLCKQRDEARADNALLSANLTACREDLARYRRVTSEQADELERLGAHTSSLADENARYRAMVEQLNRELELEAMCVEARDRSIAELKSKLAEVERERATAHKEIDRVNEKARVRLLKTKDGTNGITDKVCLTCMEQLPLGPSNDDSEVVRIEIRATLLADSWKPVGGVSRIITDDESRGWDGWPYRQPTNDGEWTGFLACQIRMHERGLDAVNWAGHHMADYAIHDHDGEQDGGGE